MIDNTKIEFVNHASILITHNNLGILSDPWYFSSIFNKGWRLLYENEIDHIEEVLSKTSHIYLSHEHPDHFNPKFLLEKKIKELILKKNITFIFQETRDKRVINFLKKNNFNVKECELDKKIYLADQITIKVSKHDFYDSSLSIFTPSYKILNLNDCPLKDISEIKSFKKSHGEYDLLLTQFSYAAWKGSEENTKLRKLAADEKINTIISQAKILNCKYIIPFASYIYFSNKMNFYMNDSANKPDTVYKALKENNLNPIIMAPKEIQSLKSISQNQDSLSFWNDQFNNLSNGKKQIDTYDRSIKSENLQLSFLEYQKKLYKKNSKLLILILSKLSFLNIFQDIYIFLEDHNKNYKFSIFNGLNETQNKNCDISMHSDSLFFIFKNEFGFDTLTVNGCFQTQSDKFPRVTKTLALGSLNAIGLGLNYKILLNIEIIFLFLKKVYSFFKKLKSTETLS